ncbi:hypothetical protein MMY91_17955 [Acinetobacter baumannii]|uniref:hypothetical protein n=1 Tax=Acinetobacter baumannii TaxID=470 RepID=UPI0022FFD130|nr:hypothetical protein [Acinetobacter baumannii]
MQASSFENYIAEKPFTDRFVQQSHQCYVRNQEADIYAMYIKRKNNLLDEDDFIKNDLVIDDFLLLEILINHIST